MLQITAIGYYFVLDLGLDSDLVDYSYNFDFDFGYSYNFDFN